MLVLYIIPLKSSFEYESNDIILMLYILYFFYKINGQSFFKMHNYPVSREYVKFELRSVQKLWTEKLFFQELPKSIFHKISAIWNNVVIQFKLIMQHKYKRNDWRKGKISKNGLEKQDNCHPL
jgi:hypothetical protein